MRDVVGLRDVARLGAAVAGQSGRLARRLATAAPRGARIGLVTGVHIAWAQPPAAETDGPVGAAVLARALALLGADVVVVTDEPCAEVTGACLAAGGAGRLSVVPAEAGDAAVAASVAGLGLSHLLAVERLGPNRAGRVMTMRAVDITASTAPLHAAFALPGLVTGAVGDGGNEIGMGNVPPATVAAAVPGGELIGCQVPVDDLVVAGTSNWGCYGLVAGLALLVPDRAGALRELLDPSLDEDLLSAATAAGGIDGVTGRPGRSVDGVETSDYRDLFEELRDLARA
ncbi:MAG TPA: glutamate cyclase domain-containing protein [Geodermatophilus sp.]|nr:glutamate cyclase domain-containing protein [Geodermatophilus sp.]